MTVDLDVCRRGRYAYIGCAEGLRLAREAVTPAPLAGPVARRLQ